MAARERTDPSDPVASILAFVSRFVPLSEHEQQLIRDVTRVERYGKGTVMLAEGDVGWRFRVQEPGLWLEPAIAFNAWPVELGRPDSFREKDQRWPSYFLFEPWLNLGWRW